jgi:H+-translocating NAD(P) transhydrogenase subunit alpha
MTSAGGGLNDLRGSASNDAVQLLAKAPDFWGFRLFVVLHGAARYDTAIFNSHPDQDDTVIVGVTRETFPGERRVALSPASVSQLKKLGADVSIERGAGTEAGFLDDAYASAGADLIDDRAELIRSADLLLQVRAAAANPEVGQADLDQLRPGQVLIAQCDPLSDPQRMVQLAEKQALVFALELVPRITRAQAMDVLSSMATIAGYKAVLLAANALPQMFPMMMTAAGTLTPARVFVVGAGVAGLQAIASSRRMGAVVSAYDVRPAVKEQVQSLGAKFVALELEGAEGEGGYAREMGEEFYKKQREMMLKVVADSDVVITTAAIPGKQAPILLTEEMVQAMPAGSVVVDLAAERGGNCELTRPGETVQAHGVTILGPLNLPSDIPRHASQMFSNNVTTFLKSLIQEGKFVLNLTDEVVSGTLVTHQGRVVHPQVRQLAGLPEEVEPVEQPEPESPEDPPPDENDDTYRIGS